MTLVATATGPREIAARAGNAWWIETGAEPVKEAPASGGPPVSMAHPLLRPIGGVLASQFLYYLDLRDTAFTVPATGGCLGAGGSAAIVRVSVDGSDWRELGNGPACKGALGPRLAGDRLWWVSSVASPDSWTVLSVPLASGAPAKVVVRSNPIVSFDADDTYVYWSEVPLGSGGGPGTVYRTPVSGGTPEALATASGSSVLGPVRAAAGGAFFAECELAIPAGANNTLRRLVSVPATGGTPTVLAELTGDGSVNGIIPRGADVVWWDDRGIYSTPVAGGTTATLVLHSDLPAGQGFTAVIATSDAVYYSTSSAPVLQGASGFVAKAGAAGTLAGPVESPTLLAVDATHLYWSSVSLFDDVSGPIQRIPLAGGPAEVVVAGLSEEPLTIALGPDRLFITDRSKVKTVAAGGGIPQEFFHATSRIHAIAAGADALYAFVSGSGLWRLPYGGGAGQVIVATDPLETRLRVSGDHVYWTDSGGIRRAATDGTGQERVLPLEANPIDMVTDGQWIFFSAGTRGLGRIAVTGGAPSIQSTVVASFPLAVDSGWLYLPGTASISRVPVSTWPMGEEVPLAGFGGPLSPNSIAVDDTSVYLTASSVNAVLKVTPK